MSNLRQAAQAALEALGFYANGEHEKTLTGFSNGKRIDWEQAREDMRANGFEFRGENYNSTENYVETGKKAYAAAQELEGALAEPQPDLLECDIEPRPLSHPLRDYHIAISEGPLNYTWKDKPHRLVYDLIAAVRYYAAPQAQQPQPELAEFVMVPREPTPEMVGAMAVQESTGTINGISTLGMAGACLAWESALVAAPQAQQPNGARAALIELEDEIARLKTPRKPMTDDQIRELVEECGLPWRQGFVPLYPGDTTNRYAVLVREVEGMHNSEAP